MLAQVRSLLPWSRIYYLVTGMPDHNPRSPIFRDLGFLPVMPL